MCRVGFLQRQTMVIDFSFKDIYQITGFCQTVINDVIQNFLTGFGWPVIKIKISEKKIKLVRQVIVDILFGHFSTFLKDSAAYVYDLRGYHFKLIVRFLDLFNRADLHNKPIFDRNKITYLIEFIVEILLKKLVCKSGLLKMFRKRTNIANIGKNLG